MAWPYLCMMMGLMGIALGSAVYSALHLVAWYVERHPMTHIDLHEIDVRIAPAVSLGGATGAGLCGMYMLYDPFSSLGDFTLYVVFSGLVLSAIIVAHGARVAYTNSIALGQQTSRRASIGSLHH